MFITAVAELCSLLFFNKNKSANAAGRKSTGRNSHGEMIDEELQTTGSDCISANSSPPTGKQLLLPAVPCDGKTLAAKVTGDFYCDEFIIIS